MTDNPAYQESGAELSECGLYRYRLWRSWGQGPRMVFIMLNPSTADGQMDDPTIRRCVGFAKRERYAGIEIVNHYALRASKPAHLLDHPDPEGPENSRTWLRVLTGRSGPVVAAWGAGAPLGLPGSFAARLCSGCSMLCLGLTKTGYPRHPLYVRADQPMTPYQRAAA